MDDQRDDVVEERTELRVPDAALGRRWTLSLVMLLAGALIVVAGFLFDQPTAIAGGLVVMLVFGLVAAGARNVTVTTKDGTETGAELPQPFRQQTRIVRKLGFPAQATRRADDETSPPSRPAGRLRERFRRMRRRGR